MQVRRSPDLIDSFDSEESDYSLTSKLSKHFKDIFEIKETKDEDSLPLNLKKHFLGFPKEKNLKNIAFYILIGCWFFPIKNILTFILEFIPKAIEVSLDHASQTIKENISPAHGLVHIVLAVAAAKILSGLSSVFKGLWYIGRCITSPVTSYEAVKNTVRNFIQKKMEYSQSEIQLPSKSSGSRSVGEALLPDDMSFTGNSSTLGMMKSPLGAGIGYVRSSTRNSISGSHIQKFDVPDVNPKEDEGQELRISTNPTRNPTSYSF